MNLTALGGKRALVGGGTRNLSELVNASLTMGVD